MNLLVVDDDQYILNTFSLRLHWKKENIERIYTAPGVRQAKLILQETPIDICICDIEMPMGDGLSLIRWIRRQQQSTEVILLTSYAEFSYAKEAIALDCCDYLVKPVSNEDLRKAIHKAQAKIQSINSGERTKQVMEEASIVVQIQRYIVDNLDKEMNRRILGEKANMNPDYFARIFKEETGVPLNTWIQKKRIEKAEELLLHTNLSLTEISMRVGFDNTAYFSKVFKSITGENPKNMKKVK